MSVIVSDAVCAFVCLVMFILLLMCCTQASLAKKISISMRLRNEKNVMYAITQCFCLDLHFCLCFPVLAQRGCNITGGSLEIQDSTGSEQGQNYSRLCHQDQRLLPASLWLHHDQRAVAHLFQPGGKVLIMWPDTWFTLSNNVCGSPDDDDDELMMYDATPQGARLSNIESDGNPRFCTDIHKVNTVTVLDVHPWPLNCWWLHWWNLSGPIFQ